MGKCQQNLTRSFYVVLVPYVLGFWLYTRGIAKHSLAAFRPLLDLDDAAYAALEYRLLTLPARPTALLTLFFVAAYSIFFWLLSPSSYLEYTNTRVGMLQYSIVTLPAAVFALVGVYRAFYQLGRVYRIQRLATRINLYRVPPLYAFSSLTATIGIGLLLPTYYIFAARTEMTLANPILFGSLVATVFIGVAAFVLPLREMHNRIVQERARMLLEVNQRFEELVTRVHQAIDANEFGQMDNWNKALANLVIERDTTERFSTWPWEQRTLTGFLTALILPIVLWVITRLLERIL